MLFIFCKTTFLYLFMWQYHHKWDNWHMPIIAQNMLAYSVRYNYQIYHYILRLEAKNINNVDNYCSNIRDLSKLCLFKSTLISVETGRDLWGRGCSLLQFLQPVTQDSPCLMQEHST